MDRFTRILQLHQVLSARRRPVPRSDVEAQLECSRATAARAIRDLRDYLGAPIAYDREHGGYYYEQAQGQFELPGLWFTPAELQSLALLDQLIEGLGPGLLRSHLTPVADRIQSLLQNEAPTGTGELRRRLQLLPLGQRSVTDATFASVAQSLLQRQQLQIRYHGRANNTVTERTVSPQRLNRYRDNWYLDAWCHKRQDLRIFSLDRLTPLGIASDTALDISDAELDAQLTNAYGIFAGLPRQQARLRFSARAAQWVAEEHWHPGQTGSWRDDGTYELVVPFNDPTELVMDILRHGPDCRVIAPLDLRNLVMERLRAASRLYE